MTYSLISLPLHTIGDILLNRQSVAIFLGVSSNCVTTDCNVLGFKPRVLLSPYQYLTLWIYRSSLHHFPHIKKRVLQKELKTHEGIVCAYQILYKHLSQGDLFLPQLEKFLKTGKSDLKLVRSIPKNIRQKKMSNQIYLITCAKLLSCHKATIDEWRKIAAVPLNQPIDIETFRKLARLRIFYLFRCQLATQFYERCPSKKTFYQEIQEGLNTAKLIIKTAEDHGFTDEAIDRAFKAVTQFKKVYPFELFKIKKVTF